MSEVLEPLSGPVADDVALDRMAVAAPRLARHRIELSDGHMVGITVAGHGIPLVVVHGFSAEGVLYAQTLSRLVSMGFKVIAIDTAGHGGTSGLPYDGHDIHDYSDLLGRVIDEIGIRHYILAGHSMGGRLVAQLAAARPEQTIAVVLIDAIVGDTWDKMVYLFRLMPPLLGGIGATLLLDSLTIVPMFHDPKQAAKFLRLVAPTVVGHVRRPWRLLGPMASILRSRSSRYPLNEIAYNEIPVIVMHGDKDFAVPLRTAKDTAERTGGLLVTVQGGRHSWLLRDPEALPAIIHELLDSTLGQACKDALERAGVTHDAPTLSEIEAAMYEPGARIFALTPNSDVTTIAGRHHRAKLRWIIDSVAS